IARWLLHARDRYDSDSIPITQEFLSEMLGVRRPTVTLAAGMLHGAGLIRYRRGVIEILDRDRLEAASCECYAVVRQNIARILRPNFCAWAPRWGRAPGPRSWGSSHPPIEPRSRRKRLEGAVTQPDRVALALLCELDDPLRQALRRRIGAIDELQP